MTTSRLEERKGAEPRPVACSTEAASIHPDIQTSEMHSMFAVPALTWGGGSGQERGLGFPEHALL